MIADLDFRDHNLARTGELISILAPSRGRPAALQAMADSAHQTATGPVEVLAYVDDDDPADYTSVTGVRLVVGPRITLSDCWNRLADEADGTILGMGSDDIRYRTDLWDYKVRTAFSLYSDRIVFVYGRDGIHDRKLGTHGFVSRRWVDTLGYFTWPGFAADYADTWIHELALRAGRVVYLSDVFTEHLHPIVGKAEYDQTHQERLARGKAENVAALWEALADKRRYEAERLEAACFS